MPRRNYRKRRDTEEGDDDVNEPISTTEAIEERKELQRFRKKHGGVTAAALALGKKLAPEEEVESDPFKLKTGGLVELNSLIQDRNRDREGEDKEKSINLGANFAAETNRRDEDTHMLKYIEDEMAKRKGVQLDKTVESKYVATKGRNYRIKGPESNTFPGSRTVVGLLLIMWILPLLL